MVIFLGSLRPHLEYLAEVRLFRRALSPDAPQGIVQVTK